ncbi:MAG: outer membrane beta-barrel protein, partial [Verrucomicrobiota bacterium]
MMKKNTFKWVAIALLSSFAYANELPTEPKEKDLKKVLDEQGIYLETSKPGIKLSGYVDAGYSYNFTGARTAQVTRSDNDGRNATENKGDFNIYNFKMALEKALPETNEWAAGFRTDLNYGEDAVFKVGGTPNDGASALWVQQAYVNFNVPIGNGLQVKFGKWSALTGFEAPERPANPNISGGLVATLEPGENVGVLGSYCFNKNYSLNFGVANADWNNNADSVSFAHQPSGTDQGNSNILYTSALTAQNDRKNVISKFVVVYNPYGGRGILANVEGNAATQTVPAGTPNQVVNEGSSLLFNHNTLWMPSC